MPDQLGELRQRYPRFEIYICARRKGEVAPRIVASDLESLEEALAHLEAEEVCLRAKLGDDDWPDDDT